MTGWVAPAALLALVATAVVAAGAIASARRWRQGTPAPVPVWAGLGAMPRRYLQDVHAIVARRPANARFHMLTAGGSVAALALLVLLAATAVTVPLAPLLCAAAAATIAGALLLARRRWLERPPELSRGLAWASLPASFLMFGIGLFLLAWGALATAPSSLGLLGLFVAGAALGWLTWSGLRGPLRHAWIGALHLAFHPRPARFSDQGGKIDSGLRPLDLGTAKLGAETVRDFAWNRLLGFDACIQCGRCEQACPAFAAGQPLNPKKFVQDLAMALEPGATDAAYTGNPHPGRPVGFAHGGPDRPLVGPDAMIHPDTIWACTTCRACVEECPMTIEHVDAMVELRRFQALELGAVPGKAGEALVALHETDTSSERDLARRFDWAADLGLAHVKDRGHADVLLWVGESGYELRSQRTLRALVRLLHRAGLTVAMLGADERDSGDSARRLGDEATFQRLARANITVLERYRRRFDRIVTADPHSFHCLKNEYPAFGGSFEVQHHTQALAELVTVGALPLTPLAREQVTYHDPCYLGRYNGEIAAPRVLLEAIGLELVEMEHSGLRSFCCGGGGGAPLTDIPGERRIPDLRMAQARATGAARVAVACPNCTAMLEGVVGPKPAVVDVAELLWQAVEAGPASAPQRRPELAS